MKVISIKQPYATLIAEGYKEYEFRTWKTKYRGEIYIHASKNEDKDAIKKYKDLNLEYTKGCIIAKATLNDCLEINEEFRKMIKTKNKYPYIYNHVLKQDKNKYAFHMTNVKKIENIEAKGQLGIWNYENEDKND